MGHGWLIDTVIKKVSPENGRDENDAPVYIRGLVQDEYFIKRG